MNSITYSKLAEISLEEKWMEDSAFIEIAQMYQYTLDNDLIDLNNFIEVNKDMFTEQDLNNINKLQPGENIIYGGGAAAEFILTRIS
jgi:hypothetical protein